MPQDNFLRLQILVFTLVAAAFTTVYLTQPVLPVIQGEFHVSASVASLTVSAVILGMALANLPFGALADRVPAPRLIGLGGTLVAGAGLLCALTASFPLLVAGRFLQGVFIPCLSTCVAAYLAGALPPARLNVVMGAYVSATVAGGLSGRLLGGWLHPPLHWRYAFVTASLLLLAAAWAAALGLPRPARLPASPEEPAGFSALLAQPEIRRLYLVPFGAFFVFSSVFNYLPFYLAGPPFFASINLITAMYLTYIVGIFIGPAAGVLSNRLGNGATMALGAVVFAGSLLASLIPAVAMVVASLLGVCAGFFAIHAAAAGSLNRRLSSGRGRANSLYVLSYYLGGALGISLSGVAYGRGGWPGLVALGLATLLLPLAVGLRDRRAEGAVAPTV
ncbi:MAG: MFS transporter [Deltaproteobacteria bacterium]|nr:MFS transporter [Deltaproteobacteria bacterium]